MSKNPSKNPHINGASPHGIRKRKAHAIAAAVYLANLERTQAGQKAAKRSAPRPRAEKVRAVLRTIEKGGLVHV